MTDRPPLTPANCDLRAFRDMPLDVGRFRDSGLVTHESAEAVVAALHLWGIAWHQVPAASLPDDDKELARFAGYGRAVDAWLAVRDGALRGFVKCSDGRLYNRTLAEKANSAWTKRLEYEYTKAKDRHRKSFKDMPEADRPPFPEFDEWSTGRAAPQPAPRRQGDLPLESAPNSAGTPSVRTPARTERAHTERARTGATTVPDDNSDGNDGEFQRNGQPIPAENALKGREGKGKEDKTHPDPPPPCAPAREGRLDSRDLKTLFDAVCEAAGFNPISPGAIDRAMTQVGKWRDGGIDFDTIVVPTIRSMVADSDEPTRTLGRFRDRILHEHARLKAKGQAGKPYRPPVSPVFTIKGEDPIFVAFRQDLAKAMGPTTYAQWCNTDVTFEHVAERAAIRVNGRSSNHVKDHPALAPTARKHGFTSVW